MSSKLSSKELFRWASFLGGDVAEKTTIGKHNVQVLKETACMSKEYRMLWAYLEVASLLLNSDDPEYNDIKEFMQPAIQILGQADWEKDTLTDLAMRLGSRSSIYDAKPKGKKRLNDQEDTEDSVFP